MPKVAITIDDKNLEVDVGKTVLDVCRENDIDIPTMCHLKGLVDVGACRLCLVQVQGVAKLLPACTTKVAANQVIATQTDKLKKYRRMITELFFAERNHVCSVCVANGNCELQDLGYKVGMESVRFPYLFQQCEVDSSHSKFVMDHNRCIMCTRCVRVCSDVEGAHNWDIMNRGVKVRIIADFNVPWGDSVTCTYCGKCVDVCPTGALWNKEQTQGSLVKYPQAVSDLVEKRERNL